MVSYSGEPSRNERHGVLQHHKKPQQAIVRLRVLAETILPTHKMTRLVLLFGVEPLSRFVTRIVRQLEAHGSRRCGIC